MCVCVCVRVRVRVRVRAQRDTDGSIRVVGLNWCLRNLLRVIRRDPDVTDGRHGDMMMTQYHFLGNEEVGGYTYIRNLSNMIY